MKTKKPISPENALARAAALCSRCEKAESDIRNKLSSWGISPDDADNITQRFAKFLDCLHAYEQCKC
jgi:regulatory protein